MDIKKNSPFGDPPKADPETSSNTTHKTEAIFATEHDEYDELLSLFETELKRGTQTLAVLSQLKEKQYGYSLLQLLQSKNVDIEAGTLYPMLRRLEKQTLLISEWDTEENRPRKYYKLSETGKKIFSELSKRWITINRRIESLLL